MSCSKTVANVVLGDAASTQPDNGLSIGVPAKDLDPSASEQPSGRQGAQLGTAHQHAAEGPLRALSNPPTAWILKDTRRTSDISFAGTAFWNVSTEQQRTTRSNAVVYEFGPRGSGQTTFIATCQSFKR